jgi:UDP-glucose 4-epimerase
VAYRVLVTGGSGFLGQHLVRLLAASEYQVDVVDVVPAKKTLPATCFIADVRDWLPNIDTRYDVIVHLAALVGSRTTIENRLFAVARNNSIDEAVFEYAARTRCGRLVYISSSAVYPVGRQQEIGADPLRESEVDVRCGPLGIPDLTYGWVKLFGEFMANLLSERYGIPVSVYRPFTLYGPGQSDDYPVTAIVCRALERRNPLLVWGSGIQCRDFVYIEDFLRVFMGTFEVCPSGTPLNIATGVGTNFIEVARAAATAVGYEPEIITDAEKPEGVIWRVGSPESVPQELRPKVPLVEGIQQLIESLKGSRKIAVM